MDHDDEMKQYFAALPVPTSPADSIVLRGMFPAARRYLEKHGCVIVKEDEAIRITYPAGTTRREILPRTMCERYRVLLPDGTELKERRDAQREKAIAEIAQVCQDLGIYD